jgi:hypothetical protein
MYVTVSRSFLVLGIFLDLLLVCLECECECVGVLGAVSFRQVCLLLYYRDTVPEPSTVPVNKRSSGGRNQFKLFCWICPRAGRDKTVVQDFRGNQI